MTKLLSKILVIQLLFAVFTVSVFTPAAKAAVIDTQAYISRQESSVKTDLQKILAREDVRDQLIQYGVNPDEADQRIAVLTGAELVQLQEQIDQLPAGSSALAILGGVFLVLLVLELLGVTNVFTRI